MSVNQHILEKMQIVSAIVPVNLATGANNGDWVSMKYYGRCAVILFVGVGTTANDPVLTLSQAKDVSGGSSKALNFTRYDYIEATALTAASGQFTTVTQAAGDTASVTGSAVQQKILVVDIKAEDLDIANGFCTLQASVADVGTNTQLGAALYLLHEPRELEKTLPSAIVN
jgi:hypothetical protein